MVCGQVGFFSAPLLARNSRFALASRSPHARLAFAAIRLKYAKNSASSAGYERGTLSRGTPGREARGRENSPRRGTVSIRARGRDKQTSPYFCALCVKYNFLWCPERYFIKLLWEPEKNQGNVQN